MLHDYITPDEKMVACPNQDVVYGFGPLAPGREPVVVQVPDFGDRFWVYQLCDQRTDGFAELGAMYDTAPGNYLVVADGWDGDVPDGIAGVLTCPTAVGICIPRVFLNDTAEDRAAIQPLINQIAVYPLSEFDGTTKIIDWAAAPTYPAQQTSGDTESQWVFPEQFADQLARHPRRSPPRPGEEAFYDLLRQVADAIATDPDLRNAFTAAARAGAAEIVDPLFQFHRYGQQLPGTGRRSPTTPTSGRTTSPGPRPPSRTSSSTAPSRPATSTAISTPQATASTAPTVHDHVPRRCPPTSRGFWSLTLYNEHHFFHPNDLGRYSLGTKNTALSFGPDGSLTLHAQATGQQTTRRLTTGSPPLTATSPSTSAYWPDTTITDGTWTPPPITRTT